MNGYQLPIAMEIRRGRYLTSYEHPRPLAANTPIEWKIPLRDRDHVFLKGHRLMVQVQSTWFPIIDRNPQRFVPSIYQATAADFVKATQRVYSSFSAVAHRFAHRPVGRREESVEVQLAGRVVMHKNTAPAVPASGRRRRFPALAFPSCRRTFCGSGR